MFEAGLLWKNCPVLFMTSTVLPKELRGDTGGSRLSAEPGI